MLVLRREGRVPMKTSLAAVSIGLALGVICPAWAEEWPETPARLSLVEGQVAVQMAGSPEGVAAGPNLPLGPGDRVWIAGHGRAEVQLPAGNILRLGDDTSLQLGAFPGAAPEAGQVSLERGMATFYIRWLPPGLAAFVVELPQGSIRAAVPSTFRADLFPDGSVQVSVHVGEVAVALPYGVTEVRSRQSLRLTPDRTPQLYALAPWDEFDRWNDLRDIQLTRSAPAPYLPPEFQGYAPDFVAYGQWMSVPQYGYVWAPTVEAGWSPFRDGRWIWWRGELIWLPLEPWGWVPYHYGRWLFYPAIGWVWIPPAADAVIWNPGAVAWITGPEFVAWIPLAPGEIFFGFRDFGPASVNITKVHVTHIHVTNVFVNTRATNAMVTVHKDVFLKGGRAPASFVSPKDVFAAGGRRAMGPPPLRPAAALLPRVSPRPVATHLRKAPEVQRPSIPTTQRPEVGERIGRPFDKAHDKPVSIAPRPGSDKARDRSFERAHDKPVPSRVEGPVLSPVEGPSAAQVKQPAPHQRRIAPEVLLHSSPPPPRPVVPPHQPSGPGEGRSIREHRGPAQPAPSAPPREARPSPARGKEGRTESPASGKGHPHPARAGGR